MKTINFVTPTLMSHLDLFSMGGSDKAEDSTKIGKYNSGLCFSMALALRHNINFSVEVFDSEYSENFNRKRNTLYTTGIYKEYCNQTGKEKELVQIYKNVSKEDFFSQHCEDLGRGDFPQEKIKTSFSIKMGVDWELWMLLRELYSNMIDEGGNYYEDDCPNISFGTVVKLTFEDDAEFASIWNNRHLYINEESPLHKVSDSVEALKNNEGYLRIYKQNILVYEDREKPSRFAWNIKFGEIDERRILNNIYSVEQSISSAIQGTDNEEFLREIITNDFEVKEKEFLSTNCSYSNWISATVKKVVHEVYEEYGNVQSYNWLIEKVRKQKDCKIGGKKITTVEDSLWGYSREVSIESTPQPYSEPSLIVDEVEYITPFASEIKKHYNFNLDVEVRIAKLKGSVVVADKFEKCLIVDESFSVENDFHDFIVQYLDLTQKGNVIDNLAKYICNLIKK